MTTVADAFARAAAEDRAALIAYLPAGFPDRDTSVRLIRALTESGADMIEVGIPYSDPLMDGPVICQAAEIALAAGTTTEDAIDVVAEVSDSDAAVLMMTYWNLVDHFGAERFAQRLAAAGGAGTITPDLTPEEGARWISACDALGLSHVFLAAPSTTDERLPIVVGAASGFVYAASVMGVTGARASVGDRAQELVARLRAVTDLPVAVGIGVSNAEQAHEVATYADGVIVGSAFVRAVLDAPDPDAAVAAVSALAGELRSAVGRHTGGESR